MASRAPINAALAIEVRDLRQALGLSQQQVARAANIALGTYKRLEQGNSRWYVEEMDQVAEALNTTTAALHATATARVRRGDVPELPHAVAEWRRALGMD
ncbi:helix-turn-helix domain-containing protein [Nocardia africana]|uniref:Helix-turn-helix domain-containing protein n=1 Tax=Nocardia africana TaxID=134964 RepID=A0ABW6NCE4_9NOCA